MDQESPTELIKELTAELEEPGMVAPDVPLLEARLIETTERRAIRLLEIANGSINNLKTQEQHEIEAIRELVETRAFAWKRLAEQLHSRTEAMIIESQRVQKLADNLANVSSRLTELAQ